MTDIELQQQLQLSTQQLIRNQAELTMAEEIIRRKQQQIQDMVNFNTLFLSIVIALTLQEETMIRREQQLVQAKDRELIQIQQQLREMVIFITLCIMQQELTPNIILVSEHRSYPEAEILVNWRDSYNPVRLLCLNSRGILGKKTLSWKC